MRLAACAILACCLLAAAPGGAAAATFDVPELLAEQVDAAREETVPILLPDRLRTDLRRLYPSGEGDARGYAFALATVEDCGNAQACFAVGFTAVSGARPEGRRVRLRGRRPGWYVPTRCGASCAPAQIAWRRRGVLYTISARLYTPRRERARMIALANQAVAAGPR